jgi:hypothetical protein
MLRLKADIEYNRYIATGCEPTVLLDSCAEVYIPKVTYTVGFRIGSEIRNSSATVEIKAFVSVDKVEHSIASQC